MTDDPTTTPTVTRPSKKPLPTWLILLVIRPAYGFVYAFSGAFGASLIPASEFSEKFKSALYGGAIGALLAFVKNLSELISSFDSTSPTNATALAPTPALVPSASTGDK